MGFWGTVPADEANFAIDMHSDTFEGFDEISKVRLYYAINTHGTGAEDESLDLQVSELLVLDRRILNSFVQSCYYGVSSSDCEAIIKEDDIKFSRSVTEGLNYDETFEPISATI